MADGLPLWAQWLGLVASLVLGGAAVWLAVRANGQANLARAEAAKAIARERRLDLDLDALSRTAAELPTEGAGVHGWPSVVADRLRVVRWLDDADCPLTRAVFGVEPVPPGAAERHSQLLPTPPVVSGSLLSGAVGEAVRTEVREAITRRRDLTEPPITH